MLPFESQSAPPVQRIAAETGSRGILNRVFELDQRGTGWHTHQDKASRLKAHGIPSVGSYRTAILHGTASPEGRARPGLGPHKEGLRT